VLQDQGVGDVQVPDSNFVQNPDFFTQSGLAAVVTRLRGVSVSPTSGGLHGTSIVSTKALPQGTELSTSATSPQPVVASTNLSFAITVEDSGDSVELKIPVTLTITQGSSPPVVKRQEIPLISPKQQTTVTFRNIQVTQFGVASKVTVKVTPVPNEANASNNTAEYSVIFSLSSQ
jgi:hypothetical protein